MSDTPEMPSEGGSYTRTPTGKLRRVEEPTVQDTTSGSSETTPVIETSPADDETSTKPKGA